MKKLLKFTLCVIVFGSFNLYCVQAQSNESPSIKPFGIGLHMEQFKISDISNVMSAPANKIVFTINTPTNFRLEPEIGFVFGKNQTSGDKTSGIFIGVGTFGMTQKSNLIIYYGARIEYAYLKETGNESYYNGTYYSTTQENNILRFGPSLGGEYMLGDHFTLGGEIALKFNSLSNTISGNPQISTGDESFYFNTDTGLFMRFYF